MKREFVWPVVVLVIAALAAVVVMSYMRIETSDILAILAVLVTPVIVGVGASQLAGQREQIQQVKEQGNGTTSRLLELIERQGQISGNTSRLLELIERQGQIIIAQSPTPPAAELPVVPDTRE